MFVGSDAKRCTINSCRAEPDFLLLPFLRGSGRFLFAFISSCKRFHVCCHLFISIKGLFTVVWTRKVQATTHTCTSYQSGNASRPSESSPLTLRVAGYDNNGLLSNISFWKQISWCSFRPSVIIVNLKLFCICTKGFYLIYFLNYFSL